MRSLADVFIVTCVVFKEMALSLYTDNEGIALEYWNSA